MNYYAMFEVVLWVIIIGMSLFIVYKEFEIINIDPEDPGNLQNRLDYLQKKMKGEKKK